MKILICLIGVAALAMVTAEQHNPTQKMKMMAMREKCWPGNQTRARCFAQLSDYVGDSLPSESQDSYAGTGVDDPGVDVTSYMLTRAKMDPTRFCQNKEKMVAAMTCMADAMRAKNCSTKVCPADRMLKAVTRFCNRTNMVDGVCMKGSVETVSSCKRGMKEKMKKWQEGSMHNSPKSMNRPSEPTSEPKPEPKPEPTPEPEPEPTSKPEPEPNPEAEKGGSGKRDKMGVCGYKYMMRKCMMKSMKKCHGPTAEVIGDLLKDFSTDACAKKIDQWAAQEKLTGDCEDGECDGASSQSVAMATLILPAWLVLQFLLGWLE